MISSTLLPARLIGSKIGTDAKIEVLLLKRKEKDIWETLVKPGKKAKTGTKISFGDGLLTGEVIDIVEEGNRLIQFSYEGIFEEILDQLGQMPLPPYITHQLKDKDRYQTVYAKHTGSAAAPTAGLHFTPELLDAIRAKGIDVAKVTLHVGLGTFRPVKVEEITEHQLGKPFRLPLRSDLLYPFDTGISPVPGSLPPNPRHILSPSSCFSVYIAYIAYIRMYYTL